ncbi:MAG TPA: sulfatase-like hydrolase/transferase, partial [Candidatus Deferrimicrobiaceae bacterium]|nr:sulfatase-like hydrolase/transferase [Candidatus Deferrimicrobiaceae bacterium]
MSLVAGPKDEVGRFIRVQPSHSLMCQRLPTAAGMSFFLLTRLAFGLLCLVTSVYCLLLYIPFSYYGFIHDPILWWLPTFVRLHAYMYGMTSLAVAVSLIPDLRKAKTRTAASAFLLVNSALSLYFIIFSSLPHLRPDFAAYSWSIFGLFPVVWLGAIDMISAHGSAEERLARVVRESPDFASLGFSAVAVTSGFATVSMIRGIVDANPHLSGKARLSGIFASLGAHIAIFVIIGGGFILAGKCSAWFRRSDLAYCLLTRTLAWALCVWAVLRIALPTLSFTGALAGGVSCAVSLALVVGFAGTVSRLKIQGRQIGGIAAPARTWSRGVLAGSFFLLAYAIPTALAKTDWDFVLQKFAVLLLWAAVFMFLCKANFAAKVRKARPLASGLVIVITFATVIGFYELNSSTRGESVWSDRIEAYAGSDISFKTAADILSRSLDNGSHEAFYSVLRQHTNISSEVPAQPSAVELVSALTPSKVKKPNIFIFVIDSLRQDLVPQYSSTATSTPEIARFASESIEFKKAFTRYAGTALSEPAIWVGALQAHKQYIQPFYPLNNLEKLLENDGYDSYVSVDPILSLLFSPAFPHHRLDAQTTHWGELDFVPTLAEIERDIDARRGQDKEKPMFVYTQPQNVHTVTLELAKHGNTRREMSVYELERIDKAFGEFIEFLKKRGLY